MLFTISRLLDKSREELEYKMQIDSIIEKLENELTRSRAEKENVERTYGAKTMEWKNLYYNLYKEKAIVDGDNYNLKW